MCACARTTPITLISIPTTPTCKPVPPLPISVELASRWRWRQNIKHCSEEINLEPNEQNKQRRERNRTPADVNLFPSDAGSLLSCHSPVPGYCKEDAARRAPAAAINLPATRKPAAFCCHFLAINIRPACYQASHGLVLMRCVSVCVGWRWRAVGRSTSNHLLRDGSQWDGVGRKWSQYVEDVNGQRLTKEDFGQSEEDFGGPDKTIHKLK